MTQPNLAYLTCWVRQMELAQNAETQVADLCRKHIQKAQELAQTTAQRVQALQERYRDAVRSLSLSDDAQERISAVGSQHQDEYAQILRDHNRALGQQHGEWLKAVFEAQMDAQKNAAACYFGFLEQLTAECPAPPAAAETAPGKKSTRK